MERLKIFGVLLVLATVSSAASYLEYYTRAKSQVMTEINNNKYDSNVLPVANKSLDESPVIVSTNIYVRSMSIDSNKHFNVILTFRNQWLDPRLKYDNYSKIDVINLPADVKVWKPDIFFTNEVDGQFHNMLTPNTLVRVHPNGEILYSTRISLKFDCPMDLSLFPFDTSNCPIRIASYAYTTRDIDLQWKTDDPVQIAKELHLPRFTLESYQTDTCSSKTNTGSYSCLLLNFTFKRESSYVNCRIYYPVILLAIVAWLAFWLNPKQASTRVGLTVSTFIVAMVYSNLQYRDSVGDISYSTSLSNFLFWTLALMLLAVIESVAVCWWIGDKSVEECTEELTSKSKVQELMQKYAPNTNPIDLAFRIFYAVVFLLLNIIYWI